MQPQLQAGDRRPEFQACTLAGEPVSLDRLRGRYVPLSFYRYASCPLCNLRVHELGKRSEDWKARGLEMLAVFRSPADKLRSYVGRQASPVPLIPDPTQRLYAAYGLGHSWRGLLSAWASRAGEIGQAVFARGFRPGSIEGGIHRLPADFLISPDHRILLAYYGRDIGDHVPVEMIEAALPPLLQATA